MVLCITDNLRLLSTKISSIFLFFVNSVTLGCSEMRLITDFQLLLMLSNQECSRGKFSRMCCRLKRGNRYVQTVCTLPHPMNRDWVYVSQDYHQSKLCSKILDYSSCFIPWIFSICVSNSWTRGGMSDPTTRIPVSANSLTSITTVAHSSAISFLALSTLNSLVAPSLISPNTSIFSKSSTILQLIILLRLRVSLFSQMENSLAKLSQWRYLSPLLAKMRIRERYFYCMSNSQLRIQVKTLQGRKQVPDWLRLIFSSCCRLYSRVLSTSSGSRFFTGCVLHSFSWTSTAATMLQNSDIGCRVLLICSIQLNFVITHPKCSSWKLMVSRIPKASRNFLVICLMVLLQLVYCLRMVNYCTIYSNSFASLTKLQWNSRVSFLSFLSISSFSPAILCSDSPNSSPNAPMCLLIWQICNKSASANRGDPYLNNRFIHSLTALKCSLMSGISTFLILQISLYISNSLRVESTQGERAALRVQILALISLYWVLMLQQTLSYSCCSTWLKMDRNFLLRSLPSTTTMFILTLRGNSSNTSVQSFLVSSIQQVQS